MSCRRRGSVLDRLCLAATGLRRAAVGSSFVLGVRNNRMGAAGGGGWDGQGGREACVSNRAPSFPSEPEHMPGDAAILRDKQVFGAG